MLFSLVYVTFFSSRCMLELKFAIYHRVASPSSFASSVDVCTIGWGITGPGICIPIVFLIAVILSNNYFLLLSDLCACVKVKKMVCKWRWVYLPAIPLSAVSPYLKSKFWTSVLALRISMWVETWITSKFANLFSSNNLKADFWNLCPKFSFQLFCILCFPRIHNKKWVHPESIPIPFLTHVQCVYTVMECIPGHISNLSWSSPEWSKAHLKAKNAVQNLEFR